MESDIMWRRWPLMVRAPPSCDTSMAKPWKRRLRRKKIGKLITQGICHVISGIN